MDLEKIMRQQVDNDSYVRWSTRYETYIELGRWINSKLDKPGYKKLSIGGDIMDHLIEQTKSAKDIMENTEMGKTLKKAGAETTEGTEELSDSIEDVGSKAKKSKFGLKTLDEFRRHPEVKKYYAQKLRYFVARYG